MIKSGRISCTGHVAHLEMKLNPHKFSIGKPEGNESFGRPKIKEEESIKWILRNII
jgi:hypothetical protein